MITIDNIVKEYPKINQADLPEVLKQPEFEFLAENLDLYNEDETIKEFIDTFILQLNKIVESTKESKPSNKKVDYTQKGNEITVNNLPDLFSQDEIEKKFIKKGVQWVIFSNKYIFNLDDKEHVELLKELGIDIKTNSDRNKKEPENKKAENKKTPKPDKQSNAAKTKKSVPDKKTEKTAKQKQTKKTSDKKKTKNEKTCNMDKLVEAYSEDVRLIRRFNAAVGKERQRRSILNIYRDFERRAIERKIRKTSPYAPVMQEIKKRLKKAIDYIDKNQGIQYIKLEPAKDSEEFYNKVADIAKSTGLRTSASLLKRFVGIEGEIEPNTAKVERLYKAFENAINRGKICDIDLYWSEIQEAKREMENYLKGKTKKIALSPQALNGLNGLGLAEKKKA